jgi:hypothetical protein
MAFRNALKMAAGAGGVMAAARNVAMAYQWHRWRLYSLLFFGGVMASANEETATLKETLFNAAWLCNGPLAGGRSRGWLATWLAGLLRRLRRGSGRLAGSAEMQPEAAVTEADWLASNIQCKPASFEESLYSYWLLALHAIMCNG